MKLIFETIESSFVGVFEHRAMLVLSMIDLDIYVLEFRLQRTFFPSTDNVTHTCHKGSLSTKPWTNTWKHPPCCPSCLTTAPRTQFNQLWRASGLSCNGRAWSFSQHSSLSQKRMDRFGENMWAQKRRLHEFLWSWKTKLTKLKVGKLRMSPSTKHSTPVPADTFCRF